MIDGSTIAMAITLIILTIAAWIAGIIFLYALVEAYIDKKVREFYMDSNDNKTNSEEVKKWKL